MFENPGCRDREKERQRGDEDLGRGICDFVKTKRLEQVYSSSTALVSWKSVVLYFRYTTMHSLPLWGINQC